MKPSILVLLFASTCLLLRAQSGGSDWRDRKMEVPGLTLAISCDKMVVKTTETVQLSAKLQYSGNDRVIIDKPDGNLLWLFHIEVKVPLPEFIPFAQTAAPTPEGRRLLSSAEPFTRGLAMAHKGYTGVFDLNKLYQMQQPGGYKVTVWTLIGLKTGPRTADAKWGTFGSNELTITVLP